MNPDLERLERLRHFLAADPSNESLACDAFDCALSVRDHESARSILADAMVAHGPIESLGYREGALAIAMGNFSSALEQFEALALDHPANPTFAYMIALACFSDFQIDRALALTLSLLSRDDCPRQTLALALRAAHAKGQFDVAQELMQKHRPVLAVDNDAASVASLITFDLGDSDGAAALSQQALSSERDYLEALVTAGSISLLAGETDKARDYLKRALFIRENAGRAWSALGLVDLRESNFEQAAERLNLALETIPQHIGTWHALGWCRVLQQRYEDARACFDVALELDRNFSETHGAFAVLYALTGEVARARAAVSRAQKLDANSVSAVFASALLSGAIKDGDTLKAFARKFLQQTRWGGLQRKTSTQH